ncbi:hypothetical protein LTR37_002454 [Vermiconidia calcicola]|uniref:Uncharacterized protein n=1 Tax=Vermiconidia calcicola TaxID=1690605 RepID=A0ACC3NVJ1_9PEZI|nr:hypothetical protein LTR37_002454 [Vermiconidia calcicola]
MAEIEETQWSPPQGNSSQFGTERPNTITTNGSSNADDVTPNTGASVLDKETMGDRQESPSQWQKKVGIDTSKQVKIVKVAHMRYQHPDLPTITKFLKDFGMHVAKETEDRIWFRGYGDDQYVYYAQKGAEKKFLGGCFAVESYEDLEKAAKIPGAGQIEEMKDAPGGGYLIVVNDPEGFPVNLVYGQEPAPRGELPQKIIQNTEVEKPRVRKFNRFTPGPAAVHKLGHYGYTVQKFDEQVEFYTRNFNLVPTDFMYVPTEDGKTKDVATFMHIDRGDDPVDHHTLFMATNQTTHVHHCSFEVHDFDTQHLGHQWLAKQNYTSVWGVGRHILGSQIFDYWWDTTGNMIEHYADGDLVNKDTPIGWSAAGDEGLAVWGPEVPKWFLN